MEAQGSRLHIPRSLLFLLLIVASFCANSSLASATSSSSSSSSGKVSLELYYESLCPYCSNLIVNYLYKIFDTGILAITDLKLVPYGNAKIKPPNSTVVCQHGPYECLLNTVEACAIDVWPNVNAHFPFVYCVENLVYQGKKSEWDTCFGILGLDPKPVTDCYESERGKELELRYAAETNELQPPHKYVPWVVVDGQPLYDNYRDFISYICEAYKGTPVPAACSEYSATHWKTKGDLNILKPVCYAGQKIKSTVSVIRSALASWMPGLREAILR